MNHQLSRVIMSRTGVKGFQDLPFFPTNVISGSCFYWAHIKFGFVGLSTARDSGRFDLVHEIVTHFVQLIA